MCVDSALLPVYSGEGASPAWLCKVFRSDNKLLRAFVWVFLVSHDIELLPYWPLALIVRILHCGFAEVCKGQN